MEKGRVIEKLSILIVFTFLLSIFFFIQTGSPESAYAQDYTPVVSVESKEVHRGQTFTIDVNLSDNQGMISLFLSLEYNKSVMRLINAEKVEEGLKSLTFTPTNVQTEQGYAITPFTMLWDGKSPDKSNGKILRLTFESYATANEGTYPITLTYAARNTNSAYATPIAINIQNGAVTLIKGEFEAVYYDWNGEELFRKDYNDGDTPSFGGTLPIRPTDECYSYTFNGWKGIVSDEPNVLKYQTDYILTPQIYSAFYYVDGENEESFDGVLTSDDYFKAEEIAYGSLLDTDYPLKARYVFSGWFTDKECSKPFTETHMPSHNVYLYGYFVYDIRTTLIPRIQLTYEESDDPDTITVYANMVANTGFNGMVLTLDYDQEALSFVGFSKEDTFSSLQFDTTNTDDGYETDGFKFYYEHSENNYETGVFLKLEFKIIKNTSAGVYNVTFTLGNTDATYINGKNGIRYTEIEIIGAQIPVGKIYEWERVAEDNMEIIIKSATGMPADTTLKVSLVPESVHNINPQLLMETAGDDMEIKAVYNLRLLRIIGDVETEVQPNGLLTIEIKLTKEQQACKRLALYYVNDQGQMTLHNSVRDGDVLRFTTDHLSWWMIVGDKPQVEQSMKMTDGMVMTISMPILLAIVTMAYALILMGKNKKNKEKNNEKEKIEG